MKPNKNDSTGISLNQDKEKQEMLNALNQEKNNLLNNMNNLINNMNQMNNYMNNIKFMYNTDLNNNKEEKNFFFNDYEDNYNMEGDKEFIDDFLMDKMEG